MPQYRIRTPVQGHTGTVANIDFVRGEATIDTALDGHQAALQFFRRRGYGVEQLDAEPEAARVPDIPDEGSGLPGDDPSFGGRPKDPADAVFSTSGETTGTEPEQVPPALVPPVPETPARPAGNASRDDWATYASVVLLLPAEEANALTRTDLVALVDAHDKETQS
jgi:hypothetical protein